MAALPPPRDVPTTPALQVRDITQLYELYDKDEKGRGAFSRVVVGRHLATGEMRAVKVMEQAGLVGKKREMVTHEKEILRRTRHKNIVYLHECIETPERVYMVMDLMKGDLFEYIVARKKLSEAETAVIMRQLLDAVRYLHDNSVVHRDIKPENILLNSPEDVKLADFGLAKVVQEWDVKSTPCGTSFYIAPEVIRGIEANGARPLCTTREEVKSIDLWSCGVVMFIMIAGRPPFTGQVKTSTERRTLLMKIDRGVLFPEAQWAHVSEEAKDLIMRMLTQDLSGRITAFKALQHEFFKKHFGEDVAAAEAAPGDDAGAVEVTAAQLKADMDQLQEDLVETGDADGDKTSYNIEVRAAPTEPKKTAMKAIPTFGKKA